MYERNPTAGLAALDPIVSFDIEHNEPYYCASACVPMWLPNLSSGSPMAAFEQPKKETDLFDDSSDKKKTRQAATVLEVIMPNGEKIAHKNASDTFVEVIEKIGIQKVEKLNKKLNGVLISTTNHPTRTQHEAGGYYIATHARTERKKRCLEEIAKDLDVPLEVKIVPKG